MTIMLTRNQTLSMLSLQAQMNAKVNPNWIDAGYPFLRAIVIEGAEAIEHHGWKWWKAQSKDLAQLQMELIDIWHFTLSAVIVSNDGNLDASADELMVRMLSVSNIVEFDGSNYAINHLETVSKLELLIGLSVSRRISPALFQALLTDCGMTWDDLFCQYVGKNVLNFFRQDHGYKQGTYQKEWAGREDNEHLVEILAELDDGTNADDFRERLYNALSDRYAASTGK